MKSYHAPGGYTIVEVMIFLAVTTGLFIVAMVAINGKQAQAEFVQGSRDVHSRIDDIMNDASNGNFSGNSGKTCSVNTASATAPPITSNGSAELGTNEACVYLGKVAKFTRNSKTIGLYTVIARRITPSGKDVNSFVEAVPVATPKTDGFYEEHSIQGDVVPTDIIVKKPGGLPIAGFGAIGFFTAFGAADSNGNNISFGDTLVTPVGPPGSTFPINLTSAEPDLLDSIKDIPNYASSTESPEAVVVCLQQGGQGNGGPRAAVILGSKGGQTTSKIQLDNVRDFVHTALYGSIPFNLGEVQCPPA